MKKNDVLGLLFIIMFFGLILAVGYTSPTVEELEKEEVEEVEEVEIEEEILEGINVTEVEALYIFDNKNSNIKDYEKVDDIDSFKIEELADKNIKLVVANDVEAGPYPYTILIDDGKLYYFIPQCSAVEEDRSNYDCVQLMDKSYLIDDIKYYSGYDYSNSLSYKRMLFYSGDKVYDNNDNLVDLNKYLVYGSVENGIGAYSDSSLTYNGVQMKDEDTEEEIKYKYIITADNGNNAIDMYNNTDFYVVSLDDKLYKLDGDETLKSIAKIKDYKFKDSYVNKNDYEVKCNDRVCNMTVILDNGEALNFLG